MEVVRNGASVAETLISFGIVFDRWQVTLISWRWSIPIGNAVKQKLPWKEPFP